MTLVVFPFFVFVTITAEVAHPGGAFDVVENWAGRTLAAEIDEVSIVSEGLAVALG